MDMGILIPIGNHGELNSTTSPRYVPSFERDETVARRAEPFGERIRLSTRRGADRLLAAA